MRSELSGCLLYSEAPQKERKNVIVPPKEEVSLPLVLFSSFHQTLQSAWWSQVREPTQQGEESRWFLKGEWAELAHREPQAMQDLTAGKKEDETFSNTELFKQLTRCMKPQLQSTEAPAPTTSSLSPSVLSDQCPYTQNMRPPKAGL